MKRNVYLSTTDLQTVQDILKKLAKTHLALTTELVPVTESISRITAAPVTAHLSSPFYSASAMDGVALDASSTFTATEETPVTLSQNQYQPINTGDPIPENYNAVVMIEDITTEEDGSITLLKSVKPYQHIRPVGEDIVAHDVLLPRNHLIKPIDISALLSGGVTEVEVYQKLRIHLIPTGDEILRDITKMEVGKIIDSNSPYLYQALTLLGCEVTINDIVPDDKMLLQDAILQAISQSDIVLVGAGSSAGSKDYAKTIIEEQGTVYTHGISIKPGKPAIIGEIKNTPIIGVPGYPVSTYIIVEKVIKPFIHMIYHQTPQEPHYLSVQLASKVYSSLKHQEFVRMKVGEVHGVYMATPLDRKAGSTTSVVQADAILEIPKNSEGYDKNDTVTVSLLRPLEAIRSSLVVTGSHDIILDILQDMMREKGLDIASSHVGSLAGVLAIKNNLTHIAPIHLLDPNTGTYNSPIIQTYLNKNYRLIKGVTRTQGLYVKKGNPRNITSLKDLVKDDITFVNRQRGSGTRTLLDYLLEKEQLDKTNIEGYDFELTTHTLVATSVLEERFDVALGIESVAHMYHLDFMPVALESYDFIVHKDSLSNPLVQTFIALLKSPEFTDKLTTLPGYDTIQAGQLIGGDSS